MKEELEILAEEIEPEVLDAMPLWFRRLRKRYKELD